MLTSPTRARGKKGAPHLDPVEPPRRRANKVRGQGTRVNDRPPVCGVVGQGDCAMMGSLGQ